MDISPYWYIFIESTRILAWPLILLFSAFLLKNHIEDLFIKHNGTEFRVKARSINKSKKMSDKLLKNPNQITPDDARKLQKEINNMYETALAVVSDRAAEVESDSNDDGSHWLYNNGQTVMERTLYPGELKGKKEIHFPQSCKMVSGVTFVGSEQPKIVNLSTTSMTLELGYTNINEIKVIISGIK